MNLLDLFEQQQHPAYRNLDSLQQAVKANQAAEIDFGSGPVEVEYPLARYILGRYQAQQTGADRGQFLAALADARKFDAIAREYQTMADRARLEEQVQDNPKATGTAFMGMIYNHVKDTMPILIDFEDGGQKWRFSNPEVKGWFISVFDSYRKRGRGDQFLELMGTRDGFVKLLNRYVSDKAKADRQRFGLQKKRSQPSLTERGTENARTRRILDRLRIQQPQANSDMEALAYSFIDAQKKDQTELDRLEKEIDSTEKSVKSDLKSTLSKLKSRSAKAKDQLSGVSGDDQRQDALLKKIVALDKQQNQAIDDLEKDLDSLGKQTTQPAVAREIPVPTSAAPLAKKSTAAKKPRVRKPKPAPVVEPTGTGVVDLDAQRAARAQANLFPQTAAANDFETLPGEIETPASAQRAAQNVVKFMKKNPQAATQAMKTGTLDEDPADIVKPRLIRLHYFRVPAQDRDLAEKAGLRQDRGGNWILPQYDKSGAIFNQKMAQAVNMFGRPTHTQFMSESLRPGEYHNAEVTFDDGAKETVKITTDEGFRDMITKHFAQQGKKVVDIDVDWSVKSVNEGEKKPKPTNPQLWGRAKSAAKSKFDVYPSAYANAWAAKWYKQHGGGWR